jgi:hypothetical protein
MRLWLAQLVVFSGLGWLLAGILDAAGALRLTDALFVSGLVLGLIASLVALEASDMPINLRIRASPMLSMAGVADRAGLGVPVSQAQALAVVSAGVAAAGLVAAAVVVG